MSFKSLLLFASLIGISGAVQAVDKSFVVVIPSYKNEKYYKKNLDSVFAQDYDNYRVIYVDDASPDKTYDLVAEYIKEHGMEDRVTLVRNEENIGALGGVYRAVNMCDGHEIIVTLDGDDWFPDNVQVLQHLNKAYQDKNVWLTYGQFTRFPGNGRKGFCRPYPQSVIKGNKFRDHSWVCSHLRTFYAELFSHIKLEDLMHDGKFYRAACDVAQMFPMLELAGKHHKFIDKVLYIYNQGNPISVSRTKRKEQTFGKAMRKYPRYSPLPELFPGE